MTAFFWHHLHEGGGGNGLAWPEGPTPGPDPSGSGAGAAQEPQAIGSRGSPAVLGGEGSCGGSGAPWVPWGVATLYEQSYAGGSSLWMGDPGVGQLLGMGYHLTGGWRGVACNVSIKEAVSQQGRHCWRA